MDLIDYCRNNGQRYLAELIGVTDGAVSRWVSGKAVIPLKRAEKMSRLGISLISLKQRMREDDYILLSQISK